MAREEQGLFTGWTERFPPELRLAPSLLVGAAVGAALMPVRWLLNVVLGDSHPYPIFVLGTSLAALIGGWASGLGAALVLIVLGRLLFGSGFGGDLDSADARIRLLVVVVVAGAICMLRRLALQVRRERAAAHAALHELKAAQEHGRRFIDLTPHIAWTADPTGHLSQLPKKISTLLGSAPEDLIGQGWQGLVHPDDLPQVQAAWERAVATGEPYLAEFRGMRSDGAYVWMRSQAYADRDAEGRIVGWYGLSENIDARKEVEAERELLMREVDHRARNMLAVLQGIVTLMPKDDPKAFATAFKARLAALAGAHTLLAQARWRGVELRTLIEEELQPYDLDRIHLVGDPLLIRPGRVQHLSMVLHELATNSAKYGALSVPAGQLRVEWRALGPRGVSLEWVETGGPPAVAPTREGFGSTLIRSLVGRQEGESLMFDWRPQGLCCVMVFDAAAQSEPSSEGDGAQGGA